MDRLTNFFHSTSGLRKLDQLFPPLFIIAAKLLSRNMNQLHGQESLKKFGKPKWSTKINYVAYSYDKILFGSGDKHSIIQMMKGLRDYEIVSRQKVNKESDFFVT